MSSLWKSDAELSDMAGQVAAKFLELAIRLDPSAHDDAMEWFVNNLGSFQHNAEYFMSIDPAAAISEFERMQEIACQLSTDESREVHRGLSDTARYLVGWSGDAADAFHRRISEVHITLNRHSGHVVSAVAALAAAFALSAHVRSDYLDLGRATVEAIDAAIADLGAKGAVLAMKVGAGVVKTVIGVMTDPAKALTVMAQGVIDIGVESVAAAVDGADFEGLVRSFARQEQRLREAYDAELDMISHSLDLARENCENDRLLLVEPLPSIVDVDSPDFSYGEFYTEAMPPGDDAKARVEQERKKMMAERGGQPDGLIGRRLDGAGV